MNEILTAFEPPPEAPGPPVAGEVDVWRVALDPPAEVVDALRRLLSADERARAGRFRRERHRRRFTVGRGALRCVLAGYLRQPPEALRFAYGERDKPRLAAAADRPSAGPGGLEFNLSHSSELALLAVTTGSAVGVDLEVVRAIDDAPEIAARHFSAAERAALAAFRDGEWDRAFLRCWTRKEAYVKALGDGIPARLDRFDVSLDAAAGARLLALDGDPEAAVAWTLVHIEPASGYVGALAVNARRPAVRGWRWAPALAHALTRRAGRGR